jgi:chromosome segregation protein
VDFLSQQLTDLTASRESLEKVIQEIEKTIQKRFLDTFYQVRKEFIILFEQLFSGGKANLELIDPDNPLDSGVEILAQPPGKRLQNLSLLSGGERAMTAIALLFAILRIKPSPFCILDEIDATLDDTNVKRFTELLKIFSKDLQFILITHRRGTMEVADVLYGVTMEEKGISKLISLDLKKQAS